MAAALDRCRSYRRDDSLECRIISLDGRPVEAGQVPESYAVARIHFAGQGFYGSPEAALSHAPGEDAGHIWLVDREQGRDCKGEWSLDASGKAIWRIYCPDGISAQGLLDDPTRGFGLGSGSDAQGRPVVFIFLTGRD